jgi:hypothetical protein
MPLWTAEQHQRLIDLVLSRVGDGATVAADGLAIAGPGGAVMGLTNLAKTVRDLPESEWIRAIEPYLPLFKSPPEVPARWSDAKSNLRIRLAADASDPGWAVYRRVCEGLDQMLLWKTNCGAVTVSEQNIETWQIEPDEVWRAALEHTIWDEPRQRRILEKDGVRIVWVRHSFWASSVLLSLGHLLSPVNRFGAVVMVPVRDALLYAEVNDERVVHASAAMIDLGGRWFVDDPGAISPDLFWYRTTSTGKDISRIVRERNRRYEPCWGSAFSEALAELSADLSTIDADRARHRSAKGSRSTMHG